MHIHTKTHTETHPIGLLGTSDQLVAVAATYTNTRDKYPCPQRDSNPRSLQPNGFRPAS